MAMSHAEILVPAGSAGGSSTQWQLNCPACGNEEVEQADVGSDHEAVTVQPDRDSYESPLGTRGGYVRVDLTCSNGHGFAFIMGNHKGAEFVGVVPRV
ncbi:hypothetical protein ITI46_06700 [Streptomyces oryzae]|uniref:Uncharacterized protein n=1 Tax=Streptomyces oryzae TaxID=1434886 RepID=A0ABS3X7N6_9ACTN|nr:hypothetical protein [Streptomyces oryzae]MBO8191382.1 hypothetical protein [Streptomyces oryzae]